VDLSASATEPELILDRRLVKKGNMAVPQVLVKWSQFPAAAATWEDLCVAQKRFPSASTWGQVTAEGGKMSWPTHDEKKDRWVYAFDAVNVLNFACR
jgi:hypothetical protein